MHKLLICVHRGKNTRGHADHREHLNSVRTYCENRKPRSKYNEIPAKSIARMWHPRHRHSRPESSPPPTRNCWSCSLSYGGGGVGKEQATVNIDATRRGVTRKLTIALRRRARLYLENGLPAEPPVRRAEASGMFAWPKKYAAPGRPPEEIEIHTGVSSKSRTPLKIQENPGKIHC